MQQSRAVSARLLLLCLLFRSSWLAAEGGRQVGAAGVLHRRAEGPAVAVSVGVAVGVHWGSLAVAPERHEAAPFTQERKRRRSAIARAGSASRLFAQHCERTSDALGFLAEEQRGGLLAGTLAARRGPTAHAV